MMKRLFTIWIVALGINCVTANAPQAQSAADPPSDKAKVVDAFGTVQKQIGGDRAAWQNVNVGDLLPIQTTLKTGDKSAALLQLTDQHVLRIGAETKVVLKELGKDKSFSFNVLSGHVWSYVRRASKPTKYEIETPSAVVGVSGTVFSVFHDPASGETSVSTAHGAVQVRQGKSTPLMVREGYYTDLRPGQSSTARVLEQTAMHRKMWSALRQNEAWPAGKPMLKLNRNIENLYPQSSRPAPKERRLPNSAGERTREKL